jgi:hypothetical protein
VRLYAIVKTITGTIRRKGISSVPALMVYESLEAARYAIAVLPTREAANSSIVEFVPLKP